MQQISLNCPSSIVDATQKPRVLSVDIIPSQLPDPSSQFLRNETSAVSQKALSPTNAYTNMKVLDKKYRGREGKVEIIDIDVVRGWCDHDGLGACLVFNDNKAQQKVLAGIVGSSDEEAAISSRPSLLLNLELVEETYAGHNFDAHFPKRALAFDFMNSARHRSASLTLDVAQIEKTFLDLEITRKSSSKHANFVFDEISDLTC